MSPEDWQTLLHRSPPHATNFSDFSDAVHLFYDRKSVAEFNFDRLSHLGTPIAAIEAIHSSPVAAATKSEDAGGLLPVVFIAKSACVMLTSNLWQEVGLCNGATGTVYELYSHCAKDTRVDVWQAPPLSPTTTTSTVLCDHDPQESRSDSKQSCHRSWKNRTGRWLHLCSHI